MLQTATNSQELAKPLFNSLIDFVADGLNAHIASSERKDRLHENWQEWLRDLFPDYTAKPFANRHTEFWQWVWKLEKDVRPQPFVAVWPRGGAKSTSAELACVAVGYLEVRKYIWYVCETQEQADKHVQTIGDMLESPAVRVEAPLLAQRSVTIYGHSKGWRRNRLMTASGLTIDAIGLDTARRGARVREDRPDLMVFDDVDGKHDTKRTTEKKKETITTSLLPAGSNDLAVLMVQNLIHENSIFTQLSNGEAGFLYDAYISGPFPAVEGLTYEVKPEGGYRITGGEATWQGQSLEDCENAIATWGLIPFLKEAQHDVDAPPGGIWDHVIFRHIDIEGVPDLLRGAVWVDPAVTDTDDSDSHAIIAGGLGRDNRVYVFYSWEQRTTPQDSIERAIMTAIKYRFQHVGIETDQGGDTWRSVFREAWREIMKAARAIYNVDVLEKAIAENKDADIAKLRQELQKAKGELKEIDTIRAGRVRQYAHGLVTGKIRAPQFKQAKAGAGHGSKVHRNSLMLTDYDNGKVIHVRGTHEVLEKALRRFPKTKPFDLVDADYWLWADLKGSSLGVF